MTTIKLTRLQKIILAEIMLHDDESPKDAKLSQAEIDLFVLGWSNLIAKASEKYVIGKRKYRSDFLTECDHLKEMDAELIDMINYKLALDVTLKQVKVTKS